ncbi:hypothetical protein BY996DRAFT_6966611, partial [Phakopsora pachyrhizi]
MLLTLKLIIVLICLEFAYWIDGMQDAFHFAPLDGYEQQLPRAVTPTSARGDYLPLTHENNFIYQGDNPLLPAVETVAGQPQSPGFDINNYLLDDEALLPHGLHDSFWSSAAGRTHHQNQPELAQPGGFLNLLSSSTDVYFNDMYNLHTNILQAENIQHLHQTTDNLVNHQSISYPFDYPFGIETPAPQISQPEELESHSDFNHMGFEPNFGYLTNYLNHQGPTTHESFGLHQLEQNREEIDSNLMQAMPHGISKIGGNANNLDEETLQFSGPSHHFTPSSDSETAVIHIEKARLMNNNDDVENLAVNSKKRKRKALNKKSNVLKSTIENRKQIIATLKKNFRVDFGEGQKLMNSKPIWRLDSPPECFLDEGKATDIKILEFGAKFNKEAKKQIEDIVKEMKVSTIHNKKAIWSQNAKMRRRLFYNIESIRWDGYDDLTGKISKMISEIDLSLRPGAKKSFAQRKMEDISIIAIVLMKVISSFFSDHEHSNLFGDEIKIFHYLEECWKICFAKTPDLNFFYQSIGPNQGPVAEEYLPMRIVKRNDLNSLFKKLKGEVLGARMGASRKMQLAWNLISVRVGVFYPEKTARLRDSSVTWSMINFFERALLYFIMI